MRALAQSYCSVRQPMGMEGREVGRWQGSQIHTQAALTNVPGDLLGSQIVHGKKERGRKWGVSCYALKKKLIT